MPGSGADIDDHYVNVPALPAELDPLYRLGFHHMHVQTALRETQAEAPQPNGFSIREGRADDLEDTVRIDLLIFEHQRMSPSFGLVDIDADLEERRGDWAEALADERFRNFVAERDGRIVGHIGLGPADPEFAIPADAIDLASIAVEPSERGTGVGVALTLHAFGWAAAHDHPVIQTAWRMTNLLASRFWIARGFRPVYHRLHRALGVG
jgi:GNAT superfamily N-acetyltransferase